LVPFTDHSDIYKLGCHVLSLTFSVTRLVWFDSCSPLESAFRPKRASAVDIQAAFWMRQRCLSRWGGSEKGIFSST